MTTSIDAERQPVAAPERSRCEGEVELLHWPATVLGPTVRIPEDTIASGAAEFFGTFQGGAPFRVGSST